MIDALYAASQAGADVISSCAASAAAAGRPRALGPHPRPLVGRSLPRTLPRLPLRPPGHGYDHYFGSADLMSRNLNRRVEAATPFLDRR